MHYVGRSLWCSDCPIAQAIFKTLRPVLAPKVLWASTPHAMRFSFFTSIAFTVSLRAVPSSNYIPHTASHQMCVWARWFGSEIRTKNEAMQIIIACRLFCLHMMQTVVKNYWCNTRRLWEWNIFADIGTHAEKPNWKPVRSKNQI